MSDIEQQLASIRALQDSLKNRLDDEQATLQKLAKRLWAQQESEKAKLSRELHDGIGQLLTGLTRRLQALSADSPELENLHGLAEMALNDVRQLSRLMSPTILDDLGLKPALSWLCRNLLSSEDIEYECTIDIPADIAKDVSILLFRIAQETLVNTIKHSHASKVTLSLAFHNNVIRLDIVDNGDGFDKTTVEPGVGLSSIRDRAKAFNAQLVLTSAIGQGTRTTVTVPV
ncbi:Two-component system NarL family sensor kinase [Alteromonas sp. 38]|uniref:sensor histidine kinase n=1 Tax=Alteromonas TaxID=226 RepID=UPI0012EEF4F8|nr:MULTISPECIES: sensor histidine kinase [Alteromonas]CAD5258489.1 Two-component system NarL family sensor kinase [Alteromonas sp. 154]VXC37399.1 Two-component system NarL family sensor kinase [Alteromonas sp. 38]